MNATIDLELLSAFVAAAETSSFSQAARRLGVNKATVSRAINKLEALVGVELLHRTTRHVALSTAGVALYERAAPHLMALRDVVAKLPEREEQPSGLLRVTAPPDFGFIMLPHLVSAFTRRYPAVRVEVDLSYRNVDIVGEGFDLAIRAGSKLQDSTLTVRRLPVRKGGLYATAAYVARRGSPRSFGDPDHEWIIFAPMMRSLPLPKGVAPRIVCNDLLFVRELVREGVGVGFLPWFLAQPGLAAGELVRVLPSFEWASQESLFLLYPSRGHVARKVIAFRDFLVETLKTSPVFR